MSSSDSLESGLSGVSTALPSGVVPLSANDEFVMRWKARVRGSVLVSPRGIICPYMTRELPWGEKCQAFEVRLKRSDLRDAWHHRTRELWKQLRTEYPDWTYPEHRSESAFRAFLEFEGRCDSGGLHPWSGISGQDRRFVDSCRRGLLIGLRGSAGIDEEVRWVAANLNLEEALVESAPSKAAINMVLDARMDSGIRARFWSLYLAKRMSPGDKKVKSTAFREDSAALSDRSEGVELAELKSRLFEVVDE